MRLEVLLKSSLVPHEADMLVLDDLRGEGREWRQSMSVSTEANGGMRLERGMRCPVSSPPEDSVRANPARAYAAGGGTA